MSFAPSGVLSRHVSHATKPTGSKTFWCPRQSPRPENQLKHGQQPSRHFRPCMPPLRSDAAADAYQQLPVSNRLPDSHWGRTATRDVKLGNQEQRKIFRNQQDAFYRPEHTKNARSRDLDGSREASVRPKLALANIIRRHMPSVEATEFLRERGYSTDDFSTWMAFLSTQTPIDAVDRLQTSMSAAADFTYPLAVLSQFLLRPHISAASLHVLVNAADRHHTSTQTHSLSTWMTLFTRFMQHARQVSPVMIEDITRLFLKGLSTCPSNTHAMTGAVNKALSIISLPTSTAPFKSAETQELALVQILQFMADHDPPLHVTARGYRAFVRVQLLLPKTEQERYWARLKALSWPPWKQDRTAMDSLLGPEHGMSKAATTLARMAGDGYQSTQWASVANIYAGHDVDGTPTIQTRAILRPSRKHKLEDVQWAARIDATRTLSEAWACWLAYEESLQSDKGPASPPVLATMKKLCAGEVHDKTPRRSTEEYQELLPGDSWELSPSPASSHLQVYTKTSPPTLHGFFQTLREQGFEFDQAGITILVNNATTFGQALEYLQAYDCDLVDLVSSNGIANFGSTSPAMVSTITGLLLRFSSSKTDPGFDQAHSKISLPRSIVNEGFPSEISPRVMRAIWLLAEMPVNSLHTTRAWRPAFHWLAAPTNLIRYRRPHDPSLRQPVLEKQYPSVLTRFYGSRTGIAAFRFTQQALELMSERSISIDEKIFTNACRVLARAGIDYHWARNMESVAHQVHSSITMLPYSLITDEGNAVLNEGPDNFLMSLFNEMTGREGLSQRPAAGLIAPLSPATMHFWVRALGTWNLHASIQKLVHWVRDEGAVAFDEDKTSDVRHLRRLITAVRAFLEHSGPLITESSSDGKLDEREVHSKISGDFVHQMNLLDKSTAPAELIDDVRQAIEKTFGPTHGAWPSEEQAREYMSNHLESSGTR